MDAAHRIQLEDLAEVIGNAIEDIDDADIRKSFTEFFMKEEEPPTEPLLAEEVSPEPVQADVEEAIQE